MNGRQLISLYKEYNDPDTIFVDFVDYTGHRARGGGSHFTATHKAHISKETLYQLLDQAGLFEQGEGNKPDMADCDICGGQYFSDELDLDVSGDNYSLVCSKCKGQGAGL